MSVMAMSRPVAARPVIRKNPRLRLRDWYRTAPKKPSMRLRRLYDFAQRVLCQGRGWRLRSCSVSLMVMVLPHPHGSPLTQVVVGMLCGSRIEAGVLGQRTR